MSEKNPIFSDSTTRMTITLDSRTSDNAAIIHLRSLDEAENMPVWIAEGSEQREKLLKQLEHRFGNDNVKMTNADVGTTTDRIITVKAKSTVDDTHIPQVNALLVSFVEENQMELDTNSPRHFRDLVNGAAQMKLRDGIRTIINDQLTYGEDKVDAMMELLRQRRDRRRDERGH